MSDSTKNGEKPVLSDRDVELLVYYIRTAEGGLPKADWAKFAEMAGFKNAHSASVSFSSVKRKVLGTADAGSSKPAAKKPIPKKPTPSKRKQAPALFEPVHTDDEDSQESPLKKLKPTPKKGLKKKQESDDEGGPAYL